MRHWRIGLLCAVGMVLTVLTASRLHIWGDERLVWMSAISQAPAKPRPWINLGRQYQMQGATALAADAYSEAMRLAQMPGRSYDERIATEAVALVNLGLLQLNAGQPVMAALTASRATQLLPTDPGIRASFQWTAYTLAR